MGQNKRTALTAQVMGLFLLAFSHWLVFRAVPASAQGSSLAGARAPRQAEPAQSKPGAVVLDFPRAYSLGALFGPAPAGTRGTGKKFFAQARGKVRVPAGTKLELLASYQACQNIDSLNKLNTDVVDGLQIIGLEVGDKQLKSLVCIQTMKKLLLEDLDITDDGFMALQKCKNLEELMIRNCSLHGKGLAALGNLQTLKSLHLEVVDLDDESLHYLSGLKSMQKLTLRKANIDDAGLKHLVQIPSLNTLNLAINHITDRGVKQLEPLKKLVSLDLRSTKVTVTCLKTLVTLPKLQIFIINYRDLRPGDVQVMKRSLPHCVICDGGDKSTPQELFAPLH